MPPNANGSRPTSMLSALGTVALLLLPSLALAHPGHGSGFLPGLLHSFHGLDHLLAAVAVGLWGARIGGRGAWALPVAFVVAMLAGMLAAQGGGGLPATEIVIALSVLALGGALATNARLAVPAGAAIVAAFALFHGAAHGTEAPQSGAIATYALGLATATSILHAGGIAICVGLRSRPWILRIVGTPIALAGATLLFTRLS